MRSMMLLSLQPLGKMMRVLSALPIQLGMQAPDLCATRAACYSMLRSLWFRHLISLVSCCILGHWMHTERCLGA